MVGEIHQYTFRGGSARLDRIVRRRDAIAQHAEDFRGFDRVAGAVDQAAQGNDVPVSLAEASCGVDEECLARGIFVVRVDFGPCEDALAGVGVEEYETGVRIERAREVRHGRQIRRGVIEAWYSHHDLGSGAEAVVAVPLGRVDSDARRVARHGGAREVHATSRVHRSVGDGQCVAGEGEKAFLVREDLADVGIGRVDVDGQRRGFTSGRRAVAAARNRSGDEQGESEEEREEGTAASAQ